MIILPNFSPLPFTFFSLPDWQQPTRSWRACQNHREKDEENETLQVFTTLDCSSTSVPWSACWLWMVPSSQASLWQQHHSDSEGCLASWSSQVHGWRRVPSWYAELRRNKAEYHRSVLRRCAVFVNYKLTLLSFKARGGLCDSVDIVPVCVNRGSSVRAPSHIHSRLANIKQGNYWELFIIVFHTYYYFITYGMLSGWCSNEKRVCLCRCVLIFGLQLNWQHACV